MEYSKWGMYKAFKHFLTHSLKWLCAPCTDLTHLSATLRLPPMPPASSDFLKQLLSYMSTLLEGAAPALPQAGPYLTMYHCFPYATHKSNACSFRDADILCSWLLGLLLPFLISLSEDPVLHMESPQFTIYLDSVWRSPTAQCPAGQKVQTLSLLYTHSKALVRSLFFLYLGNVQIPFTQQFHS